MVIGEGAVYAHGSDRIASEIKRWLLFSLPGGRRTDRDLRVDKIAIDELEFVS